MNDETTLEILLKAEQIRYRGDAFKLYSSSNVNFIVSKITNKRKFLHEPLDENKFRMSTYIYSEDPLFC